MSFYMKRTPGGMALGWAWAGSDDELEAEIARREGVVREAGRALQRRRALAELDGQRIDDLALAEYVRHGDAARDLAFAQEALRVRREVAEYAAARKATLDAVLAPIETLPPDAEGVVWGRPK